MCKALLRIFGKVINVSAYAPKAGALPTALHPDMVRLPPVGGQLFNYNPKCGGLQECIAMKVT